MAIKLKDVPITNASHAMLQVTGFAMEEASYHLTLGPAPAGGFPGLVGYGVRGGRDSFHYLDPQLRIDKSEDSPIPAQRDIRHPRGGRPDRVAEALKRLNDGP